MALIRCPECNKEISSRAASCPNCGCPIAEVQVQNTALILREREAIRWKVLCLYFYTLKRYCEMYLFLTSRIEQYTEAEDKLAKSTINKLKNLKTSYKEASSIIKKGGISFLENELSKLYESTEWKRWSELNDQIGENIEKKENYKEAYITYKSLEGISESNLHAQRSLISMSTNTFSKKRARKGYKQVEKEVEEIRSTKNALKSQLDNLQQEYDDLHDEREKYDDIYQKKEHLVELKDNYASIVKAFSYYYKSAHQLTDDIAKLKAVSKHLKSIADKLTDDYNIIPEPYRTYENIIWLSKYVNSTDEPVPLATLYHLMTLSDIKGLLKESNAILKRILNEQQAQKKYIQSLGIVMMDINNRVAEMNENIREFEQRLRGDITTSTMAISDSINNASSELQREINNQSQDVRSSIDNLSSEIQRDLSQQSGLMSVIAESQAELAKMNLQEVASLHADLNLIF